MKGKNGCYRQCFFVVERVLRRTVVTGQSIPPAGLYPGLKWPRLDYTRVYYGLGQFTPRVYYGLGQFIPPNAKLYTHDRPINYDINSVERYTQELYNF